jgi:elongation factor 1-beta
MAMAIVTLKIMPESPDVDLKHVEHAATKKIDDFTGESGEKRFEIEPIAFGLKALKITFVMDEKIGSTDSLEQEIGSLEGVNSVEVTDVRRAIG